jgi:hypothetical protein
MFSRAEKVYRVRRGDGMTRLGVVSLLLLAFAIPAFAAQVSPQLAKPDFTGTWQVEGKTTEEFAIEQTKDTISIRETANSGKAQTEVKCGMKGSECTGRVAGEEAKIVFYFSGPMLVQTTDNGKEVYRTRRTLSDDGRKITEEVVPLVPPGKPETRMLVKAGAAAEVQSAAKTP